MKLHIFLGGSLLLVACSGSLPDVEPSPGLYVGPFAPQRKACEFQAGATVEQTLGVTAAQRAKIPIDHVIVLMKENRSFDHLFGQLSKRGQPDAEPLPRSFSNLDDAQKTVRPFHQSTTCVREGLDHGWDSMHAQVDGGRMDGFVTSAAASTNTNGHFAMGWYDDRDLPFYYFLANTFAIADRNFPSARSGTWPNRDYLLLGTSDGVMDTGHGVPRASLRSVFDELDEKGISWGVYADNDPFIGSLGWTKPHRGVHPVSALAPALANGTAPHVIFVDGRNNVENEHPGADMQVGEAWTRRIYEAASAGPMWNQTAIVWTYDEGGGFFDHVPPPDDACIATPTDTDFFELGVRVPLVVVSPWARRHYVSHVQHEHTSILRFIQLLFDLPALTARDANSDALLDMFDFEAASPAAIPDAPMAGAGRCH